jgi:hypothetical protein
MIPQFLGVIIAIIGFFTNLSWLFFIGGFICLFFDIFGFISGRLNPTFPIVLYIGGFIIVGNWTGILYGSVVGNLIEGIFTLIGIPFFISSKKRKLENKLEKLNQQEKEKIIKRDEFFKK